MHRLFVPEPFEKAMQFRLIGNRMRVGGRPDEGTATCGNITAAFFRFYAAENGRLLCSLPSEEIIANDINWLRNRPARLIHSVMLQIGRSITRQDDP